MKQVLLYVRVNDSGAEHNRFALQAQEKQLREYCKTKGYRITNVYTDVCDGTSGEREGLNQLLTTIRSNTAASEIVVIKQHSSLSTVPAHLTQLIVVLHQNGIILETTDHATKPKRHLPLWHYVNLYYPRTNPH